MIAGILIPLLKQRFPNHRIKIGAGSEPCVTFLAVHPEVGDVQIHDDGEEITLIAGNFTHGHFSNYDKIPVEEKEKLIAENVVAFLDKLFADQVVLWGSHKGGGGWRVIASDSVEKSRRGKEYVWSGPRQPI
jgi:hypothetical protein